MVDELVRRGVSILFAIGGDGTLRGAGAIAAEVQRRGLDIAVVGIPKTIDNDISYIHQSFGFQTAASEAQAAVEAAHTEAVAARNGIGLVKLMGAIRDLSLRYGAGGQPGQLLPGAGVAVHRGSADAAAAAPAAGAWACRDCRGGRGGAGPAAEPGRAGCFGNVKYADIGLYLRDALKECCTAIGMDVNLKYIDPSYTIRSVPANAYDSGFSLLLGHNAVHAGMSGRTNMVVGNWRTEFTHVPIAMATHAEEDRFERVAVERRAGVHGAAGAVAVSSPTF